MSERGELETAVQPALGEPRRACSACASTRIEQLRRSVYWKFTVGRCLDCGTAFAINPPEQEVVEDQYDIDTQDDYVHWARETRSAYEDVLGELRRRLEPGREPTVFDIGAGVGDFLAVARECGFRISGSELNPAAAAYTLERHGIAINTRRLSEQEPASADALTMWCVLAHVPEPEEFLVEALAMLRPGGILFLRTPRWCAIDTGGVAIAKATRNRVWQIADGRISLAHLHLFSDEGLRRLLERAGFVDVEVVPTCHYGLNTDVYLNAMGFRTLARLGKAGVDRLIDRGWFIRNADFVYARRPRRRFAPSPG